MLHVNEKWFNLHSQLWKDSFKIIWKVRYDILQLKKAWNIFRSKKAYGLKISQSFIYVKKFFIRFSRDWKILYKHKLKQIPGLARNLWLFA